MLKLSLTIILLQFIGGAGRFFEGTAQEMYPSLYEKLGILPPETKVYCGHEVNHAVLLMDVDGIKLSRVRIMPFVVVKYTFANYKFAVSVDPQNKALQREVCKGICSWLLC